jgi:hypothetical protein
MSFLNDPLFVETMQNEKKVTQRDIEMAQWYEETQAAKVRQPRRTSGLLGQLHGLLVATWQRRPQATRAED